ncbi:MAG: protein kinase, partial [Deltaproteobacteria bacterium]|nr:protein kinase [Deltaproteobacteria bacterium]
MIGQKLKGRFGIAAEFFTDKLGTAWKATDSVTGSPVVVLVLDEQVSTGGDAITALMDTSRTVRELQSPLLVPTVQSGITDEGKVFLVLPLTDAVPLSTLVPGGLPIEQVIDLSRQIATGCSVAAEAGLQHLDLSGNSVLVSILSDGGQVVRVTRYGYRSLLELFSPARKNASFYGTPEYMAPELCSGKGADPTSDIYSLGILMYEMIVGKCPFVSSNAQTVLKRQIFEKPLPLHLLRRGVPGIAEFEKIVFQALQKMPARRQESMAQVVEQLDAFRAAFLAEAELTPLPTARWAEIAGEDEAPAGVPREAERQAERRPAETMMFSGITPGQIAADARTEPDVGRAAAEAEQDARGATLQMPYVQAERLVEEAIAESTAETLREARAAERREEPPAAKVEEKKAPSPAAREKEEPEKKTLVMAPIPKREEPAAVAPSGAHRKGGKEADDDWFVEAGQDLASKEQPQTWDHRRSGSNLKLYLLIGALALLVVGLIVVVISRGGGEKPAQEEPAKTRLDPAMERQLEQERKAEEARKAELARAEEIRLKIEADRVAKARAEEEAAKKATEEAAEKARLAEIESRRTALTDRFLAVRTRGEEL